MTKTNISIAVNIVNQFFNYPCNRHWDAWDWILNSPRKGLTYENRGHVDIMANINADS